MTTVLNPPQGSRPAPVAGALDDFRTLVEPELLRWLDRKEREAVDEAGQAVELTSRLREFVARGGKRLRPALVYFAYSGCGGSDQAAILPLAMATELLHTYLLIHDDIMDSAALRRGEPTAHLVFESDHRSQGWPGSPERHGESVAILLGDLAHSFAIELMLESGALQGIRGVSKCFVTMCQEVVVGQYLEMTAGYRTGWTKTDLLKVLRLKSGRYSVERPIELGALAAEASTETVERFRRYGMAMGEAFQLKDDLLGVFGASNTVGKSVDSDIAEGKFTVLVQQTLERSDMASRDFLRSALGNRDVSVEELAEVRSIVESSGAKGEVERMIERRLGVAAEALGDLPLEAEAGRFFRGLIDFLRDREH